MIARPGRGPAQPASSQPLPMTRTAASTTMAIRAAVRGPLTANYQLLWWITSSRGRRLGLAMGRSGRSAG